MWLKMMGSYHSRCLQDWCCRSVLVRLASVFFYCWSAADNYWSIHSQWLLTPHSKYGVLFCFGKLHEWMKILMLRRFWLHPHWKIGRDRMDVIGLHGWWHTTTTSSLIVSHWSSQCDSYSATLKAVGYEWHYMLLVVQTTNDDNDIWTYCMLYENHNKYC